MERIIKFGDYEVPFKATAGTLARYRSAHNRDLLADFKELMKAVNNDAVDSRVIDIFVCFAHTMARQADPEISPDPFEWVDQFEIFPISEIMLPIIALWADSLGVTVETPDDGKKKGSQAGRKRPA